MGDRRRRRAKSVNKPTSIWFVRCFQAQLVILKLVTINFLPTRMSVFTGRRGSSSRQLTSRPSLSTCFHPPFTLGWVLHSSSTRGSRFLSDLLFSFAAVLPNLCVLLLLVMWPGLGSPQLDTAPLLLTVVLLHLKTCFICVQ